VRARCAASSLPGCTEQRAAKLSAARLHFAGILTESDSIALGGLDKPVTLGRGSARLCSPSHQCYRSVLAGDERGSVMRLICSIVLAIVASFLALAGSPDQVSAAKRVAFVVGIDKYDNLGPQQQLQRAVSDARSVATALTSLGYDVMLAENIVRAGFNAQWQKFLDKLHPGDTAAVYFSGHGVEIEGLNFLLPRDVPNVSYGRQEQVKRESLSVSELLLDLRPRKPQVTLLILDACREHPLIPPEFRSAGQHSGLARMDAPEGTFIMYSAGAGETALDRLPGNDPDKINSVYTRRLLPLMKTPGMTLPDLARQLRVEVRDLTASVPHMQRPAYYDGLIGKFCLAACEPAVPASQLKKQQIAVAAPPPAQPATPQRADPPKPAVAVTPTPPISRCDGVETLVANDRKCLKPKDSFKDCPECPEMVVVPAGEFMMGSPSNEPDRFDIEDQVQVTIASPFAVGRFAVTFAEWDGCVADGGCNGHKPSDEGWGRGNRPVINVSWDDAKAFTAWLSKKTGKTYRLLSESEREYVTRAGTTTPFWWGSTITPKQANYDGTSDPYKGGGAKGEFRRMTVPVNSFEPNPWGLYNVHGNVWEWTEDCWNESNKGNPGDGLARTTGECNKRVRRGGGHGMFPGALRSAARMFGDTDKRVFLIGFRLARTLGP
jgi:formylglycine-generating enzyme required for sulfatase activity